MMKEIRHCLVARDKPGLLVAMMRFLCGGARVSFEGDLSRCLLLDIQGASDQENCTLRRNTQSPQLDFVVVPLEQDTVRPIMDRVLPQGRIVHDVIHVQIEKGGKLAFGAYDNFHPDCIVAWSDVPESLLEELKVRGVLKSYELARDEEDESRTTA